MYLKLEPIEKFYESLFTFFKKNFIEAETPYRLHVTPYLSQEHAIALKDKTIYAFVKLYHYGHPETDAEFIKYCASPHSSLPETTNTLYIPIAVGIASEVIHHKIDTYITPRITQFIGPLYSYIYAGF